MSSGAFLFSYYLFLFYRQVGFLSFFVCLSETGVGATGVLIGRKHCVFCLYKKLGPKRSLLLSSSTAAATAMQQRKNIAIGVLKRRKGADEGGNSCRREAPLSEQSKRRNGAEGGVVRFITGVFLFPATSLGCVSSFTQTRASGFLERAKHRALFFFASSSSSSLSAHIPLFTHHRSGVFWLSQFLSFVSCFFSVHLLTAFCSLLSSKPPSSSSITNEPDSSASYNIIFTHPYHFYTCCCCTYFTSHQRAPSVYFASTTNTSMEGVFALLHILLRLRLCGGKKTYFFLLLLLYFFSVFDHFD